MEELKDVLSKVTQYAKVKIIAFPERVVYHDLAFAERLNATILTIGRHTNLSTKDLQMAQIVGWFFSACFDKIEVKITDGIISDNNEELTIKNIKDFIKKENLPDSLKAEMITNAKGINFFRKAENDIQKTVSDAITADLVCVENVNHHIKLVYQEYYLIMYPFLN